MSRMHRQILKMATNNICKALSNKNNQEKVRRKMKRRRVCVILETPKGVLVAQHRFNFKYALPGGGIKGGEEEKEGIRREIKEETNLELYDIKYLFEIDTLIQKHKVFKAKHKGKIKTNWEIKRIRYTKEGIKLGKTTKKIIEMWERKKEARK